MLGADPEFNILVKDRKVNASKLMPALFAKEFKEEKNAHANNQIMGYLVEDAGSIGWDGMTSTAEIRPAPSKNPNILIENIGKLLKAFSDKTKLFTLSTSSAKSPVGGHIHIALDKKLAEKDDNGQNRKMDNIHKRFVSYYLPVLLGEDVVDFRTRQAMGKQNGSNYGQIDDYRVEFRDKQQRIATYELRVPSAEWLTTPEIAKATIAYLATVYNEIINHPKNFGKAKDILFQSKKQSLALQDLALTRYLAIVRMLLGKIRRYIKTFEYYPCYQKEIDFILSPQRVLTTKRKNQFSILKGWKFDTSKQPTKKLLLSEKRLAKEALKTDVDTLGEIIQMPFNPDTNVEHFVKALKSRIVALNWKFANTYFLYGLRPCVPDYIAANRNLEFYSGRETIMTKLDWDSIRNSLEKMNDRFSLNLEGSSRRLSDTSAENKTHIMIGIPYEKRMKLEIKDFIKLVYVIEKGKLKPKAINERFLFDDTEIPDDAPPEQLAKVGKIFMAYNQEKFKDIVSPTLDSETRQHERTAAMIRNEVEQEARQEIS